MYHRLGVELRRLSEGEMRHVIVTYPTIAPPLVRRRLRRLVESLGFTTVRTDYDEAVSAALFYLMREFQGSLGVGLEAFRARCRPARTEGPLKWSQNVMVFDIGGGTTDLALIQLILEEIDPFDPGEDRGAGGRLYKITPKVLGSSGHLQLGGEYVTLRVFHLLKAAIADRVLRAIDDEKATSEKLAGLVGEFEKRFKIEGNRYNPGSILEAVDRRDYSSVAVDALKRAEGVVPTRWMPDCDETRLAPQLLEPFYTLWDYAEEAKQALGRKPKKGEVIEPYTLNDERVRSLLKLGGVDLEVKEAGAVATSIDVVQFDRVVEPVVDEAVQIALGVLKSRLPEGEVLDWLILSGKTCNLALVERRIREVFLDSPQFVWNPERITFEPEFAKNATSIGAAYAESRRAFRLDERAEKPYLQAGCNRLFFDVKNLFFFLPCGFDIVRDNAMYDQVFRAGDALARVDHDAEPTDEAGAGTVPARAERAQGRRRQPRRPEGAERVPRLLRADLDPPPRPRRRDAAALGGVPRRGAAEPAAGDRPDGVRPQLQGPVRGRPPAPDAAVLLPGRPAPPRRLPARRDSRPDPGGRPRGAPAAGRRQGRARPAPKAGPAAPPRRPRRLRPARLAGRSAGASP